MKVIPVDRKAEDRLGTRVAINGNYAVISAPGCDSIKANEGAVYVYWQSSDGKWVQSQKLLSSDHGGNAGMGISVALDNGIAISGATIEYRDLVGKNELSNSGAAYIFTTNTGPSSINIPNNRIPKADTVKSPVNKVPPAAPQKIKPSDLNGNANDVIINPLNLGSDSLGVPVNIKTPIPKKTIIKSFLSKAF